MKKVVLSLVGIMLLAGIFMFYSTFKTRNFVDAFITEPEDVEEVVKTISIWGENGDSGMMELVTLHERDEQYAKVLSALSEWEVKRVLFDDADSTQKRFILNFPNTVEPMKPFDVLITADGILNVHGKEFKLVEGHSIEELVDLAQ